MKLVELKCENCGALLKVEPGEEHVKCEYCQTVFKLDNETSNVKLGDMEQSGYEFEKGRIKAQVEHQINNITNSNASEQVDINPIVEFLIVFFLGGVGVHKFIRKDFAMGIVYLFTFGIFGIGWIVDTIIAFGNMIKYILANK